ncbi:hypothetical protein JOQ06_004202 [Pogonophryne albipinna]|uniref:Uncharacterized protein n=1 Tax=Pogonophryne albipinna TaxID=1090488 RepID=A0AAD6F3Q0_9TELE|nr:hypothetical protein JOQ06_004202 [Pogonophryne albipinna]
MNMIGRKSPILISRAPGTRRTSSSSGGTSCTRPSTYQRFVSVSLKRGCWIPEEDAQLRELVEKMRIGNFIPYTQSNDVTL